MESTGIKNKIQISHATCDLLIQAGKDHWIRPREETIQAKGKGFMQTYWLSPNASKKGDRAFRPQAAHRKVVRKAIHPWM